MTPATQTAGQIARGEFSVEHTVEEALAAARSDTTNSFTFIEENVDDRVQQIEASVSRGEDPGPLAGVPIAVKDLIDQAGRVTTAGSAFFRHHATESAPAVTRLEEAGVVIIGRTGLHEFAYGFSSENPWFGPVLNPWDHSLSPGGSSGGSAAAVAAGIVPIALGTDTGGSVRVPAALCSVSGLKVTHGRIPLTGVFPLSPSLDTVGPIATTLDDLETATELMSDPGHPTLRSEPVGPEDVTLAVPREWVESGPITDRVASSFQSFLDRAAEAGATIDEIELPELAARHHIKSVVAPEVSAIHRDWREAGRPYGEDVAERIDADLAVTSDEIQEGREWRARLTASVRDVTRWRIIVTPSVAAMDKRIGDDFIEGRFYRAALSWFSAPVNQTGCPALSVPLPGPGRTDSVQLIGDWWGESRLLAAARTLVSAGVLRDGGWSSDIGAT